MSLFGLLLRCAAHGSAVDPENAPDDLHHGRLFHSPVAAPCTMVGYSWGNYGFSTGDDGF